MSEGRGRHAVFLDRDGTLIDDVGYPRDPATVHVVAGAMSALRELSRLGFALVVVSNQSGIARGLVSTAEAAAVHESFVSLCAAEGVQFDAVAYCPHGPTDGCGCRKPAPGMLLDVAGRHELDLERSFMVGDKASDMEAGRRAGCHTILIRSRGGSAPTVQGADGVASNWSAVCTLIREAMWA